MAERKPKLFVLEHDHYYPVDRIVDFAEDAGFDCDVVRPRTLGDLPTSLEGYVGLMVPGSVADPNAQQMAYFPGLIELTRQALTSTSDPANEKIFYGECSGMQIAVEAAGGRLLPDLAWAREVGPCSVVPTTAARRRLSYMYTEDGLVGFQFHRLLPQLPDAQNQKKEFPHLEIIAHGSPERLQAGQSIPAIIASRDYSHGFPRIYCTQFHGCLDYRAMTTLLSNAGLPIPERQLEQAMTDGTHMLKGYLRKAHEYITGR
ncbi:hypothetical protein ACIP5Y_25225 [Nocardia sp. NPDC088792]|uniref:hypothetical protein n=1 Tax=Nocardia sp. NPDC088792 TaxID=3364332 RepID=UPI00380CD550